MKKTIILAILLIAHCSTPQANRSFAAVEEMSFKQTITENGLDADFFCRPSDQPQQAIILLGGSEGGKSWSNNRTALVTLLDQGYCVMSLSYFGTPQLPQQLQKIPLEYFENAFRWLASQKQIAPDHYAVIGSSRGGELALLLASRYPQIKAIVAIAPSHVVFQGKPANLIDATHGSKPAWTYQGQAIPFVSIPLSLTTIQALWTGNQVAMHDQAFQDAVAVEKATISVEQIRGSVLCVSNTEDNVWHSTWMCDQVVKRLREKDFQFHYEHIAYGGSHNLCNLTCWNQVLNFLSKHYE
jgi:dienelactone hydrolase